MICSVEKRGRDCQAKRLGAVEIDDQFKLCGLLNGEIVSMSSVFAP
jgi:hypothetical protein